MIYGGHQHAEAEAHQQTDHQNLVAQGGVEAQELQVKDRQADEQDATDQMAPDIDLEK